MEHAKWWTAALCWIKPRPENTTENKLNNELHQAVMLNLNIKSISSSKTIAIIWVKGPEPQWHMSSQSCNMSPCNMPVCYLCCLFTGQKTDIWINFPRPPGIKNLKKQHNNLVSYKKKYWTHCKSKAVRLTTQNSVWLASVWYSSMVDSTLRIRQESTMRNLQGERKKCQYAILTFIY